MSELDQVVFVVENGKVVESTIRDLSGYIDETTTPLGVAPRFHVRGTELWTWGTGGNNPRRISEHETEEAAVETLESTFATDFWNSSEITAFKTRELAEKWIADVNAGTDL